MKEREGGVKKKNNKIQYTVLTAAQYTHRSRKTSSTDATVHFKVTFQSLFNKQTQ